MRAGPKLTSWVIAAGALAFACGGEHAGGAAAGGDSASAGTDSFAGDGPGRGGGGAGGAGVAGEAGSAAEAGAAAAGACAAALVDGLEVYSAGGWDPLGYPPYAFDGCELVYVAAAAGADNGALHWRDLSSGSDVVLAPGSEHPRRPAVSGSVIAWESDAPDGSRVRVRYTGGPQLFEIAFDHAGEPRVTGDAVVFTAFLGAGPTADTDVDLFDLKQQVLTPIATGPGQQRFADVSPTHVAVTDFSEDPQGYFNELGSIADVLVVERGTLQKTSRAAPGKQAFPLLGDGGVLAYLEWGAVHPEPKFSQFMLKAGYIDLPVAKDFNVKGGDALVSTNPAYVRPSLHGTHLDYIDDAATTAQLYRVALDLANQPAPTAIPSSPQLFGPVATDNFTLLAKPLQGTSLELFAVER